MYSRASMSKAPLVRWKSVRLCGVAGLVSENGETRSLFYADGFRRPPSTRGVKKSPPDRPRALFTLLRNLT